MAEHESKNPIGLENGGGVLDLSPSSSSSKKRFLSENENENRETGSIPSPQTTTSNGIKRQKQELPIASPKPILFNAFLMSSPGHLSPGQWCYPGNQTGEYTTLRFWTETAQTIEKAGFDAMFIADVLGGYDVYNGPHNVGPGLRAGAQFPVSDPLYAVPAMAAVTKDLVFGVTASTTYDAPYALARRFSTVDHLTNGRVAWNIVTSYLDSAARNFGLETQIPHDERYEIADEYMDVVYKLWEGSWRDGAVLKDRVKGLYADSEGVREIHHKGKYFNVPGPHICEPSRQRTPFLFQAGTSKRGIEFGAKHAEAIFVRGHTPELIRKSVDEIRSVASSKYGRESSSSIKFLAMITIIVDETDSLAESKRDNHLKYGDREGALALFGGWTGIDLSTYSDDEDFRFSTIPAVHSIVKGWSATIPGGTGEEKWTKAKIADYLLIGGMGPKIVGGPKKVVDELERWIDIGGLDGFNVGHVVEPGSWEDFGKFVVPELKKRGLFRERVEGEGLSAREQILGTESSWLAKDHPGRQFRWS
ncbi:putative xenobiotic compound family [Phaeomoniella chlamydospora]|uniref:Putative xenobiotic compound family n=1 Tax=Phaeomoniella chlamydospora TaxID=158046 RepID=A0A0G2EZ93_PHACM|nr:putative xenobiotic compound family [Phaeomoniella chlamydospora]